MAILKKERPRKKTPPPEDSLHSLNHSNKALEPETAFCHGPNQSVFEKRWVLHITGSSFRGLPFGTPLLCWTQAHLMCPATREPIKDRRTRGWWLSSFAGILMKTLLEKVAWTPGCVPFCISRCTVQQLPKPERQGGKHSQNREKVVSPRYEEIRASPPNQSTLHTWPNT